MGTASAWGLKNRRCGHDFDMRRLPRLAAIAVAALVGAGLAGCNHSSHPSLLNQGVNNLLTAGAEHQIVADRGSLRTADFQLASGVTTVVVHSADLGGDLYRITTPAGAGIVPAAVLTGDHVIAQVSASGIDGPSVINIALSKDVGWTIHLDGGSTSANVDMKNGGLTALDFSAGVTRIDASLPSEHGTIGVRMAGGASEFTVHGPTGVPVRVTMGGGGWSATIDGIQHTGIAGGTVYTQDDWSAASNRLDIDNTAGVSTFVLDRY
jgi:hypothetical protein